MKKILSIILVSALTAALATACSGGGGAQTENEKLVVGFAQVGQESGWRDAETNDIQWYAARNTDTIELKFADAQQKQENQIAAIKDFIEQGVDVVGFAPVVTTGWDAVLKEAKDAGIPVVQLDRNIDNWESFDGLYLISSDMELEGSNAADEMAALLGGSGNVVELYGTVGSSAADGRSKGFSDQLAAQYPGITILDSQSGDFTRDGGKAVMESFLKTYEGQINGVFAHNDDMILGAIEAMKEAGVKPGQDIKNVSCDGVKGIFEAMVAGEANVTVECNPLLAEQFFTLAADLKAGRIPSEKWQVSKESVFRADTAAADLPNRVY
jgi:simple sugar transport system substrate-binding protein